MKKLTHHFLVMLCLAGALPGLAAAQVVGGLKIGAVNFRALIEASPQIEAIRKKLDEDFASRKRDLIAKQNDLNDRKAKLLKDSAVMGVDERRNAEDKLRNDERELTRRQNEYVEDSNLRQNDELTKLQAELVREVQAFAKQRGYDLIIGDGVLYAAQGVDITKQILDDMVANYKGTPAGKSEVKPAAKPEAKPAAAKPEAKPAGKP